MTLEQQNRIQHTKMYKLRCVVVKAGGDSSNITWIDDMLDILDKSRTSTISVNAMCIANRLYKQYK